MNRTASSENSVTPAIQIGTTAERQPSAAGHTVRFATRSWAERLSLARAFGALALSVVTSGKVEMCFKA